MYQIPVSQDIPAGVSSSEPQDMSQVFRAHPLDIQLWIFTAEPSFPSNLNVKVLKVLKLALNET